MQAGIEIARERDTAKATELESWIGRVIDDYGILPLVAPCHAPPGTNRSGQMTLL